MRGENDRTRSRFWSEIGTSPRARGKPRSFLLRGECNRNIPACAGKTSDLITLISITMGTSPRARGKHVSEGLFDTENRNIPACAGKTKQGFSA